MHATARPVLALASCLVAALAPAVTPVAPPAAPPDLKAQPVEETYFGTRVTDRFRFIEAKEAGTLAWMKSQGDYTRALFDSIPPRAAYLAKMSAFGAAFGIVNTAQVGGSRVFYLERKPGADVFNLVVREASGAKRTLVDTAALIKAAHGVPQAIDYFAPSRDGARVAVGISAGGSEASSISVLEVGSGRSIAGPIDRAQFGSPSWLDDNAHLFFLRMQELKAGAKPTDRYLNSGNWFWDLQNPPLQVVGASVGLGPVKDPQKFPALAVIPGAGRAVLLGINGVQNEFEAWLAPVAQARSGHAAWQPLVVTADAMTGMDANASTIYLLTHKDAPTFKVVALPLGSPLSAARTVLPARADRVVESIHLAADALYVVVRAGLDGKVLRIDAKDHVAELALPFHGTVQEVATDPTLPGAIVSVVGWVNPETHFRYDPASAKFTDLKLETAPRFDASRYQATETFAAAADGTHVPLSVVTLAGPRKPRPLLLTGYGSYGISSLPLFLPRVIAFADAGGTYAECHVRGGGELGEAWRLGGKDANKPNTWRDLIACAQQLIAAGWTTPQLLTISGTSAGGITVGRAATERPELFAGAIGRVGDLDVLRSETMPSGPANVPEFGTFKDEQGFRNLYAMDAYLHVRDDGKYPAFLLTTGLNDPRVEPWEPAKMAARLMEIAGHQPVLLRVEDAAGHGLGTTKSTRDAEEADIAAFVFWRAGVPAWQPHK